MCSGAVEGEWVGLSLWDVPCSDHRTASVKTPALSLSLSLSIPKRQTANLIYSGHGIDGRKRASDVRGYPVMIPHTADTRDITS